MLICLLEDLGLHFLKGSVLKWDTCVKKTIWLGFSDVISSRIFFLRGKMATNRHNLAPTLLFEESLAIKGWVYLGEHRFSLGSPKRTAFNNKDLIHYSIWRVVKDIKRNPHELSSLVKNLFFEFVCFPEF